MPAWIFSDPTRAGSRMRYGAGGAQHPDTLMWQLWVSFDGQHINWVAAYRHQRSIDEAMKMLRKNAGSGNFLDLDKAAAVLDQLYNSREAEPQPLPGAEQVIRQHMRTGSWA